MDFTFHLKQNSTLDCKNGFVITYEYHYVHPVTLSPLFLLRTYLYPLEAKPWETISRAMKMCALLMSNLAIPDYRHCSKLAVFST
jgi:hypothetical protein